MEITNIYDFLHLLNLIKIRFNMDFEGGIWHLHIYATRFGIKILPKLSAIDHWLLLTSPWLLAMAIGYWPLFIDY
jgi:hypothetical protein